MADWKIIIPVATINLVLNPSIETNTTGWAANAGAAISRSSVQSRHGVYSLRVVCGAGGTDGAIYTPNISVGITTDYSVSIWLYTDNAGVAMRLRVITDSSGNHDATFTTVAGWQRQTIEFTTDGADTIITNTAIIKDADATVFTFYLDALQAEEQSESTTYCDGGRPGCTWNGAPHAATSTRSAAFRGGGLVRDLKDDYSFAVETVIGAGMPPVTLSHNSYSLLPGGELNGVKTEIRPFTLQGNIQGTGSGCDIHPPRNVLEKILAHDTYPKSGDGWQPVRLRYAGAVVTKEADAHYTRGLGGALSPEVLQSAIEIEKVAIGFDQDSVFWEALGDGSQVLDTNDSATLRYVSGRLKSTGQWDDLGLTANPTTIGVVYAILVASDGTIYVGGQFTGMDGAAGRDYIASYNVVTDTWSTVGGGSDFNSTIFALVEGPDGIIYAGGDFANAAGVAAADGLAQWDGANWTAVGAGSVTGVRSLAFGLDGILYIGGAFANFGGVGNADNLAQWDGAAYTAVGGVIGPDGAVNSIAIRLNGDMVMAGAFVNVGGVAALRVAQWDGAAFTQIGNGTNAGSNAILVSRDNTVYLGGDFTQDGDGNPLLYVAQLGGSEALWVQLGSGMNNTVHRLAIGPDDVLYAGGDFTIAGGITLANRVAKWNGSSWAHLDVDLPGVPNVRSLTVGISDPVINRNYDVWIGFFTTGASTFAGLTTVTNDGNTPTFPQLVVNRSGGTEAILQTLRNESTGLELLFDYSLLDGETLTIDLNPQAKTIISSMFGSRPDAMLAGSDFGVWSLLPDGNQVTCFVSTAGAPTVVAYLIWKTLFKGID